MIQIVVADELWPGSGNTVTAQRMARAVGKLGLAATPVRRSDIEAGDRLSGVQVLHGMHARRTGPTVRQAAQANGLPYVITLTGTDLSSDLAEASGRQTLLPVLADAAAVVVFDRSEGARLGQLLPELTTTVVVVPPGALQPPGASWRRRLGLSAQDIVFFLPAGMRAVKRPLAAVDIVERLLPTVPQARLLVAGAEMDSALVAEVAARAAAHPWMQWLGAVPYEQVGGLYRAADVVLNTSEAEGLANSLLEAMAFGKPTLAQDNMGNRAALGHVAGQEAVGLLFSDPDQAVAEARQLALNRPLRVALGRAAKRRATSVYNVDQEAALYADLYRTVLAGALPMRAEAAR
ncbi:MAG: glycosyltransferase [Sulfobacillus sp.]